MINAQEQMRAGAPRSNACKCVHDFRGFIEHLKLAIFGGQEIETRRVARSGGNLFLQDPNVPVILAA
jgi:hypothetical protein